ncbi:dihydrolipoamide acetyltransferase family protein [Roseicyclus persicicus]|uniref:Dihydrolipoamide acetyltransferase component of pyruvate dehydrogenase complex n=1 Tax=Roseicyclus persicicus TaxID=2650661 RepID=A0A7X6H0C9_9RHOB|nr:dihydrolipoamide acetyltransferase family protein [Roseibacterium persicicum]NKX45699.1 2-oxo acid dehydrogenase subunit E2 [Roseibacterium persicicum]
MGVFRMPSLGADMEAGRLVEWLVKPGDTVSRGDVVAVVETQKGAIEIEIFEAGTVRELTAALGDELPVGAPLAVVVAEGEAAAAPPEPAPEASAAPRPAPEPVVTPVPPPAPPAAPAPTPSDAAPAPTLPAAPAPAPPDAAPAPTPAQPAGGLRASPAARALAEARGVDLSALKGSGPGGAILYADVEHAAAGTPARKPAPMAEMRKAIAAAMARSKRTIPHFYMTQTIDVELVMTALEARNAEAPPEGRILLGALLVRAAVRAARAVPEMNGHYLDDRGFVPAEAVNVGVAIALRGGGLVAPALMDAGAMTLAGIMAGMRDLVTRARAGRLKASEMTEGTITVSALGETGAEAMAGVIFPPQVGLVGLGAPQLRPWVVDGAVVPRRVVTLTLSADHRVSDGRTAARFVAAFAEQVQTPEEP